MGYRSDVRILTTQKGFKELKKFTDKYLKTKNYTYGNLLDNPEIDEETKYAKYVGWNCIKWYEDCEGYEEVDAVMNGLNHLKESDYSYRYARIGEDYSDYEESYYESNREEEQDLEFPCMNRCFDDDYIIDCMRDSEKENDIEI